MKPILPEISGGAAPLAEALGTARIWFDLTTSMRLQNLPPVGITRVESRYAAELARDLPGQVGFCRYDGNLGLFRIVEPAVANATLDLDRRVTQSPRPKRRGPIYQAGRNLERWFRLTRRRLFWGAVRSVPMLQRLFGTVSIHRRLRDPVVIRKETELFDMVPFRAGDLLVLGGATWERHDMEQLRELRDRIGVSLLLLCYDLVPVKFPHFYSPEQVVDFERFAEFIVREASLVLCISEATRRDLQAFADQKRLALRDARVVALGHSLSPPSPGPPEDVPSRVRPGDFVLYVSTIQVRKNHHMLYQIWRRFAERRGDDLPYLVFVGIHGWQVDDLLSMLPRDPLVAERIVILSRTTDAELAWLYRNCLFTVYPSLYEGWGLPISESLAHGKVCIASDNSSMPEAGQGLALHLDPLDFAAWYREIESLIDDPDRRRALEAEIAARYRRHDWSDAGRSFAREVARFLAERPPTSTAG